MSKQFVFCLIESINGRSKVFCSFVYASNAGRERRTLWKDLEIQKRFTNGDPWILMGDFKVTLKIEEHYTGSSFVSTDMSEFQRCVDAYEIDDLKSSGFFFTWSKSPQQPTTSIFKKLDRVMINDGLLQKLCKAHALFLPYMSSDHCPTIFIVPNEVDKKVRSFRITNYIADKEDFIPNVCKG
ncbi:RNA-directed DNA polymerase, eukaryota, reverse transcriptase zinc-binding domain protein [Tanacetum coccineum]